MSIIEFQGKTDVPFWSDDKVISYGLTIAVRHRRGASLLNPDWPRDGKSASEVIRELQFCKRAFITYSAGTGDGRGFVTLLCGPYAIHTAISADGALILTKLGIAIVSNEQRAKLFAQSGAKPIQINGISMVNPDDYRLQWENSDKRYKKTLDSTRDYVEALLEKINSSKFEPLDEQSEEENASTETPLNPQVSDFLDDLQTLVDAEYELESLNAANSLPYQFSCLKPRSKKIVYRQAFELTLDPISYQAILNDNPSLLTITNFDGAAEVLFEVDELEPINNEPIIFVSTERQTDTRRLPATGELKVAAIPTQRNVRQAVIEKLQKQQSNNNWLAEAMADTYQPPPSEPVEVQLPPSEHPPTESQLRAIQAGAGSSDYTLVLGPPGTGKTTVILSWVRHFVSQGKRVLITSKNNKAVDNVLERLMDDELCECLRVGNEAKVSSSLHSILLDAKAPEMQRKLFANIEQGLTNLQDAAAYVNYLATNSDALVLASKQKLHFETTIAETNNVIAELEANIIRAEKELSKLSFFHKRIETKIERSARHGWHALLDWFSSRRRLKIKTYKRLQKKLKRTQESLKEMTALEKKKQELFDNSTEKLIQVNSILAPLEQFIPKCGLSAFNLPNSNELELWESEKLAINLAAAQERLQKFITEIQGARQQSFYELLLERINVVGATCIGINTKEIFRQIEFDVVIADESGQIQLHDIMVPLSRANQAILVGDHKQLPPIVDDTFLEELEQREINPVITGYQQSWFELMWKRAPEHKKFILDTQFRCPAVISDFVSHAFYDGKYYAGKPMYAKKPLFDFFATCMLFIDTKNERPNFEPRQNNTVVGNPTETSLVIDILAYTAENKPELLENREIGIIVPYKKHIEEIKTAIKKAQKQGRLPTITIPLHELVASVDSFQGQERDLIIFPFTRANPYGNIGFLQDWRRLNVAQTRAKRQLIMIGHSITLTSKPTGNNTEFKNAMRLLIKTLRTQKGYWHAATLRRHMQRETIQ